MIHSAVDHIGVRMDAVRNCRELKNAMIQDSGLNWEQVWIGADNVQERKILLKRIRGKFKV